MLPLLFIALIATKPLPPPTRLESVRQVKSFQTRSNLASSRLAQLQIDGVSLP